MRPLAALLLLLLLATEPTEPATRSELAEKKMSELVVTMQRLEAPQHEIDGCFDGDDPTQAAIEIILRLDGAQAAGGTEQRESELSALKTSCVALQRYALRLVLPW